MLILMDQSTSMSETVHGGITKWSAVSSAINAFVQSPGVAGMSIGMQYFGLPSAVVKNGVPVDSCQVSDYQTPDVELDLLPQNGAAMTASIAAHWPSTESPTEPALQGAIEHISAWGQNYPDKLPVVLIVTDGEPFGCGSTVSGTASVAAAAASSSSPVLTFVVGIGGSMANLDAIAQSGGSGQPFYLDPQGSLVDELTQALDDVADSRRACVYEIPQTDAGTPDFDLVNVTERAGGSSADSLLLGRVAGAGACGSSSTGWYYSPAAHPRSIQLCPAACSRATAGSSTVEVAIGCMTHYDTIR
jgi:hypothetical protein